MPPRVLLADDHEVVRQALKALLERHGFQVVGEAPDGRAAVDAACRLRPDIAVLDVAMPLLNGVPGAHANSGGPLSPRERQVLQLVAEGKSSKQIADLLQISVKTAEFHRGRVMDKLDIHDTAGLVRYAIREGLITP